jgi:hypothetical protein
MRFMRLLVHAIDHSGPFAGVVKKDKQAAVAGGFWVI